MLCSCAAENAMRKGEKFLALGEYYDAAEQFKKAYSKTPPKERELRGQRALKAATCYARVSSTMKALACYRNAVRFNQAKPEDRLTYARLLLKNGEYKAALKEFEELSRSLPPPSPVGREPENGKDSSSNGKMEGVTPLPPTGSLPTGEGGGRGLTGRDFDLLVKNGLISAKSAPEWKKAGSAYTVKKMDVFNGRRADYCPVLAGDQYDRLYFTSTRNEAQGDELSGITGAKPGDIFFSDKDEKGVWGRPQEIASGLNTEYDEGACCLSVDGSTMYLTQCPTDPQYPRYATIATAQRSDAAWGKATEFKITNDTLSAYAHPAISPDGEWLYFVSDMPGGKGGLDIWRTRLVAGGTAGVENLGEPINTPGNEMFPTFRPNGDFYFSSDGHPGMGGLDVFIAVAGDDNKYHLSHPGYPLNSQGDDFGLTFEGNHNKGFFSSNRGDARGWDHIYSFENPEVVQTIRGWIYEQDGYELTNGVARIVGSDGTNQTMGVKSDGSFEYVVTPGVDYIVLGSCPGFLNHKEELHVDSVKTSQVYDLQFPLASISAPVLVDNIFYVFNKADLLPESTVALDSLVMMLTENPNITIELSAHTDYRGSDEYNKALSQKRAETVVDYLIKKGIAAERLTPVGYGEEHPKTIRKKVAEHYPWLKEGDVLTEEFITKLKPDQQETANALNRRTEFKVLRTTYDMFDEEGNIKNPPKPKPKVEETEEEGWFEF